MKNLTKAFILAGSALALAACSSEPELPTTFGGYTIQELQQQANTVHFGFDRYDIDAQYQGLLNAQAAYLMAYPQVKVQLQGYTDERGTPEYNIALGQRRADAVQSYLLNQGVKPEQLSTISYGEEKPAVLGHSEEEHAKNRRGVLAY